MKVSGFGYCSPVGHKNVGIYINADGRYYVQIDFLRSTKTFDNLNDVGDLWSCVKEVEDNLTEIRELTTGRINDPIKSNLESRGPYCPDTPME